MERQRKDGEAEPVVIGGMVLDIQATSSIPPHPRTTCPGKVHYVRGGVARNIAECMWKLGANPFMISALGFDMAGNLLLDHWKSAKLPTEGIRKHEDIKTPTVCHILDVTGEVAAGVASVEAVEMFLTPEWIQEFKHKIHSSPILMVDANLSPAALEASCQIAAESDIPVWFEPVSVAKSKRIAPVVKYVTFASPNEDELIAMANALSSDNTFHPIEKNNHSTDALFQKLKLAIWLLLEKGVKILVLTIGSDGVILCSKGEPSSWRIVPEKTKKHGFSGQLFEDVTSRCPLNRFPNAKVLERSHFWAVHFPALPASVVRLTGAGDCLVGGMLASLCAGLDVMQSVAIGISAAKASVEADSNVPSQFSLATIAGGLKDSLGFGPLAFALLGFKRQWALPHGLNFAKSPKCIVLMRYLKDSLVFHVQALKAGFTQSIITYNKLIHLYSKQGFIHEAQKLFDEMPERNVFTWNTIISAYKKSQNLTQARALFDAAPKRDLVTYNSMLSGYVSADGYETDALALFKDMQTASDGDNIKIDEFTVTTMLNLSAKLSKLSYGTQLHCFMVKTGNTETGFANCDAVFQLLGEFWDNEATIPDALILMNVLGACALQAALDQGKQTHCYMLRVGIEMDEKLFSAIIDMYSKCGNISYAEKMFRKADVKDSVIYNVMMAGYAHHGHESKVFQLFEEMLEEGIRPDVVTFIALLSACRHCGLVELGEKYFNSMTELYKILPENDHYTCMIDLYGRANQLEKAVAFMKVIPVKKDAAIMGAFLNACRLNKNAELAREAEEKLLEIEGDNGARYVQLANIYAAEGNWEEMGRIRKEMRGKVKKFAGCSWVFVDNEFNTALQISDDMESEIHGCFCFARMEDYLVPWMFKRLPSKPRLLWYFRLLPALVSRKTTFLIHVLELNDRNKKANLHSIWIHCPILLSVFTAIPLLQTTSDEDQIFKSKPIETKARVYTKFCRSGQAENRVPASDCALNSGYICKFLQFMDLTSEVGLRLLFSPISSNIVVRTACCTVGTVIPVYSTFKAIENKDQDEQQKWLLYWTEVFADKILSWFPLYYHAKFAFLVWLQLPSANGAKQLYASHLRPFLLRHQARLDQILEFIYSQLRSDRLVKLQSKFISSHRAEIRFARALFVKLMASVNRVARDLIYPVQRQPNRAIEGSREVDSDALSDCED
ncbi:hypothetical protein COLO4_32449 [Corchorus olitorius]|uniref:Carbohydrate kinase PfkB domain-containing protein n=1 Tax=Corchorus olitorius TaxID=93759 RepID=A0A1R3GZ96_9ROSI|nr:hypothetical protein COLO4_32449 [Corchorus olitorius]